MAKTDKLIITHKAALQTKYKTDFTKLEKALGALIKADKAKGLNTQLVYLDDKTQMQTFKAPVVTSATNLKQFKAAIDGLYKFAMPDYVMIFGSIDVVPHQKLNNPLWGNDDEDRYVPSDLPYACEEPYNTDANKFIAPVRVVGRLADLNGKGDIAFAEKVINNTINATQRLAKDYKSAFAITAKVWNKSTRMSVDKVFSSTNVLLASPKSGPVYATELKPLSHFINCHGADVDDSYYGQQGENYPKALSSSSLTGKVAAGTVVAAECCYGAQLYSVKKKDTPMPTVNSYFNHGAIAMVGSTTIAYGPADDNDQADLICQYFFFYMLGGSSTGRALLEARQKYILNHGPDLSPTDLKTISQFNLIGDPSVHPVKDPANPNKKGLGMAASSKEMDDPGRMERRKFLFSKGTGLTSFVNKLQAPVDYKADKSVAAILKENGMDDSTGKNFEVKSNPTNAKSFKSSVLLKSRFLLFSKKGKENKKGGPVSHQLLTIKQIDGKVVSVKKYDRK